MISEGVVIWLVKKRFKSFVKIWVLLSYAGSQHSKQMAKPVKGKHEGGKLWRSPSASWSLWEVRQSLPSAQQRRYIWKMGGWLDRIVDIHCSIIQKYLTGKDGVWSAGLDTINPPVPPPSILFHTREWRHWTHSSTQHLQNRSAHESQGRNSDNNMKRAVVYPLLEG